MSTTDSILDPATSGTYLFWIKGDDWVPLIQGGAEGDSGDGDGTSTDNDGGTSTETDDGKGGKDDKVFTQDQLNAIVTRETQKAVRGKLDPKELGFDSAKEMKDWVDSMKAKADEAKTEDDKAREEAIETAKREATDSVLSKANERILKAEFLLAALDHNVRKEARNDAYLLAPTLDAFESVQVDEDGKVVGFDEDLFTELKEKKPYLFEPENDAGAGSGGDIGAGRRSGGDSDSAAVAKLRETYPALQQR